MRTLLGAGFVLLAILLFVPGRGLAASPQGAIDSYVQKVLQVFQKYSDTDLQSQKQRKAFKQELSSVAQDIFAYRIMVRMSLGRYWSDFNPKQQEEMVDLFVRLIEDNYFGKLMEYMDEVKDFSQDMIRLTEETVFSSRKAEVRSVILYEDKKIPVDYRLLSRSDGEWQVYDIHVEDVSLVRNYRSQFQDLLIRKSPEEVLASVRQKIEKNETTDVFDSE